MENVAKIDRRAEKGKLPGTYRVDDSPSLPSTKAASSEW